MSIQLDLRTLLPLTRAAFEAGELQFQQPGQHDYCRYSGPCAIGVGIPEERRRSLDADGPIEVIVGVGAIEVPLEQLEDFRVLQLAHDSCVRTDGYLPTEALTDTFVATLTVLEAKYVDQA